MPSSRALVRFRNGPSYIRRAAAMYNSPAGRYARRYVHNAYTRYSRRAGRSRASTLSRARASRARRRTNFRGLPGIAPKTLIANFKLCHVQTLVGDASDQTRQLTQSIFDPTDPLIAQAALQPAGWEQWATFYDKYETIEASLHAKVTNRSTTNADFVIGIIPEETVTDLTAVSYLDWCDFPRVKLKHLTGLTLSDFGASKSISMFHKQTNFKKYFKGRGTGVDNNLMQGTMPDTSPTNTYVVSVLMARADDGVPAATHNILIKWTWRFKVKFSERKQLTRGTDT